MCDKTSSLRVPYITFYGNWWLLAKNRDTREKKLAFLEAILSYAFDGVEVDFDGDGKKHGVDYAALDGFLAAQPVVDTQIRAFENGRKTWNKRRAVAEPIAEDAAAPKKRGRKAKKAHDDTPPEPADETISDEVPHTKEQTELPLSDAPKPKKESAPSAAPQSTPVTSTVDEEGIMDGKPYSKTVYIGNPDNADRRVVTVQDGVRYITCIDEGSKREARGIPLDEVLLFAKQRGIDETWVRQWHKDMIASGWTYHSSKYDRDVSVTRRSFVSVMESFWRMEKKKRKEEAGTPEKKTTVLHQEGYDVKRGLSAEEL